MSVLPRGATDQRLHAPMTRTALHHATLCPLRQHCSSCPPSSTRVAQQTSTVGVGQQRILVVVPSQGSNDKCIPLPATPSHTQKCNHCTGFSRPLPRPANHKPGLHTTCTSLCTLAAPPPDLRHLVLWYTAAACPRQLFGPLVPHPPMRISLRARTSPHHWTAKSTRPRRWRVASVHANHPTAAALNQTNTYPLPCRRCRLPGIYTPDSLRRRCSCAGPRPRSYCTPHPIRPLKPQTTVRNNSSQQLWPLTWPRRQAR